MHTFLNCSFFIFTFAFLFAFPSDAQQITKVIDWRKDLNLNEKNHLITPDIKVRTDTEGGFLVTDSESPHVRIYGEDGSLKTSFGKKGEQAPGGFTNPAAALRHSSGNILIPDINGSLSLFNRDGEFVERFPRVVADPSHQVYDLPIPKTVLLVGAQNRTPGASPLLHHFHLEHGRIEKSFFPHPIAPGERGGYLFGISRIATADVRSDRIVAAFSLSSSLHFFNLNGTPSEATDLSLKHFRTLESPTMEINSQAEFLEITKQHSSIHDLFWVKPDLILVQYYDLTESTLEGATARWTLAGITPDGERLFEIPDSPRLLAVDRETGDLFFRNPDHESPAYWKVGRLQTSILP